MKKRGNEVHSNYSRLTVSVSQIKWLERQITKLVYLFCASLHGCTCTSVTVRQDLSMCLLLNISHEKRLSHRPQFLGHFAAISPVRLSQSSSWTGRPLMRDSRDSYPALLNVTRNQVNHRPLLLTSSFWCFSADWEMQQRKRSASSRSGPSRRATR